LTGLNQFNPNHTENGLPVLSRQGAVQHPYDVRNAADSYGFNEIPEEDNFDPLKLLWYIVRYRWIIAALMMAGMVSGFVFTYAQTPLYRATTKLEIFTPGAKIFQELEVVTQASDNRHIETARLKLLSRDLARRVSHALNLPQEDSFLAPQPRFSLLNFVYKALGLINETNIDGWTAQKRESAAVNRILSGLSAISISNTAILAVSFSHPNPSFAANVANQAARSFIDQNVDKTSETSDLARQFLEEQVRETKATLQASEKALVEYTREQNITLTGDDASLIAENIAELNGALATAIQERLGAERYLDQVKAGNAAILPEVFESPSIRSTRDKIAVLKASYEEKRSTLKPGYPEMRRIQAQIAELQRQVDVEIHAIANTVEIRYQQARQKEEGIKRELATLEKQQREFQDKNIQYTILKREVDSNRTQYDSLIDKRNEVGIGSELRNARASIIDLAMVPDIHYTPSLSRNLIFAFGLFGGFAVALIYISELLNNNFAVPDQIESELKLPVLGIIPAMPQDKIMQEFEDTRSNISEAYRSLRTSLQFSGTENNIKTLLVTSSEPSEGKSSTVYKMAQDFAALGRKVLVIDADLRRPQLHRLYNLPNTLGLSNLLSNVVRQGDVMQLFYQTGNEHVTFLSSGTIPPNPVDLLASQKMGALLKYCSRVYDLIIIDSPPVLGLADAPILSRQADATLMVVASQGVSRKSAKSALTRLRSAGGKIVGAALTKFSVDKVEYNYNYRYMQYGYHSYREDDPRIGLNPANKLFAAGLAPGKLFAQIRKKFVGQL
jgi:polysaccharide biosynthesis transport protein